jgi:hypothetical protein
MSGSRLFGDAKATAREADPARKAKRIQEAKERVDREPTAANQLDFASALFEAGRYQDAEAVLKDMTRIDAGNDPQVLFELGYIYKNLKRKAEAIEAFAKLISEFPKHNLARSAESAMLDIDPEYRPSWMRK